MKKKILVIITFLFVFITTGCFGGKDEDVVSKLTKKIENCNSYHITGVLEIINNEDKHTYDIDVSYQKEDNFRVSLKNQINNHEQIILKNEEAVFVLTPSLRKSFKFQSEWPYNNSQSYLLQTVLKDIKNDNNKKVEKKGNSYIITTTVNYSNNKNLVKQKIYVDKNINITKVEVLNEENDVKMKMTYKKTDLKAKFDKKYFDLDENMEYTADENETKETISEIEDIIYPMYMPENTYLDSQDTVALDEGERVILNFTGDSPFMLVQETVKVEDDYVTIPVYGDPEIIGGSVGSVSTNSANWIVDGIEYYAVSDILDNEELMQVVNSINVVPVGK